VISILTEELVRGLGRIGEMDRTRCRAEAEQRFSPAAMSSACKRVYAKLKGQRITSLGDHLPHLLYSARDTHALAPAAG